MTQQLKILAPLLCCLITQTTFAQTLEGQNGHDSYATVLGSQGDLTDPDHEIKLPLKHRIENSINKFLNKDTVSDAIVAGTIASAASAHPAGALVGSILGAIYDKVVKGSRDKDSYDADYDAKLLSEEEELLAELATLEAELALVEFEEEERQKYLEELQKALDCYGGAEANKTFARTRKNINHCFYYAGSLE